MTLKFLRNKVIEVTPRPEGDFVVSWRLTDDLFKVEVQLIVAPPDLEITEADAVFERYVPASWRDAAEKIKKIEGVSIGSGLRKITAGLLGGEQGCPMLVDAVLECCNAVILYFTRPNIELGESITDPDQKTAALREMIQSNPRLVRSCISFQDDSPIMKELQ
ncbi:MAG: DUF2889 domain-containing protein [Deltaproteobacteria bacterium]|nr:DUF2889 domain-containing protein [Deltaproteobacteria bacterium]